MSTEQVSSQETINADRRAQLDQQVAQAVRGGWHVESRSEFQAVLVKGKRPNHILHLLLTVVTAGLWLPVGIYLAVFKHVKQQVITV